MLGAYFLGYGLTDYWVFSLELFAADLLFFSNLKTRKKFLIRFIATLAVYTIIWLFVPSMLPIEYERNIKVIYRIVYCIIVFVSAACAMYFCFDTSWRSCLFYCTSGYATQHMSYIFYSIIQLLFLGADFHNLFIQYLLMSVVYISVYFMFRKGIRNNDIVDVNTWLVIIMSLIALMISVVLYVLLPFGRKDLFTTYIIYCYAIISCVLILFYQYNVFSKSKYIKENEAMQRLYEEYKKHYEMSMEQAEIINIKCHDIKRQIRAFRHLQNDEKGGEWMKKIEKSVMIYDAIAKTGNDALDVIITEKALYCEANGIHFSYMADGRQVDFLNAEEIFSLFGNAFDNAIDAVSSLEEDKRVINFFIRKQSDTIHILLENYYEGEVIFDGDFPVTTKENKTYHGYGMQSINRIVKEHSGKIKIIAENHMFSLNIFFFNKSDGQAES